MHGAPSTARDIAISKMAAVIPANAKGTNKGRFCRAKAFIRNTAADRMTTSRSAIDKQGNEKKNVCDPEVCSGASLCGLRVVEFNLKMSWLRLWMGL